MTSQAARSAQHRLSIAITAVLAITAGTALASAPTAGAAPAGAAPLTAVAAAADRADAPAVAELPVGTEIAGAGPNGFLATTEHSREGDTSYDYRWYRPDGTSTLLAEAFSAVTVRRNAAVSDIVTLTDTHREREFRLHDMSAPAGTAPVVFDLDELSGPGLTYEHVATVGSTLLVQVTTATGAHEYHLLAKSGDTVTDRRVTGLTAAGVDDVRATADTALLWYRAVAADGSSGPALATLDLATATVGTAYPVPQHVSWWDTSAIDAERLVWWRDRTTLVVTDRATGAQNPITLSRADTPYAGLLGDWIVYGTRTAAGQGFADDPLLPLVARPSAGGDPVKVLDHVSSLVAAESGSLLVRGGTVEKGEGIYRITLGADRRPAAELIASTGEDTALTPKGTNIGPVVDLDPRNNRIELTWNLSHPRFTGEVNLIHKKSGRRYHQTFVSDHGNSFAFVWRGNFASSETDPGSAAYNGDYRWEFDAAPMNGIGPDLHATGDFKLVRSPKVHDFNDNGSADLLARDSRGNLRRLDTVNEVWSSHLLPSGAPVSVGSGWNGYRRIESVGDVAGTKAPDVIGVDASGVLWLHPGTGEEQAPLAPRVRIGGGWQVYDKLAGGSDLDGDGRADLIAADTAGDLWFYKGTGNPKAPYAPRKKNGFGWGVYNQLTAVGNIAGGPAGDLVARDRAGALWLYLGKGDGTFAGRVRIGGGWNQYSHLVGIGDATMDGRPDLYVFGPNNTSYVYAGTGDWRAPFAVRTPTRVLTDTTLGFDEVL
ncbi:VCBS repeat-containing protein [Streptomyces sp. NBC_01077]|uniref:FG-GAP repeat domain-containing protein n=1 Tax=Streptomyces sp. NBC_01077 TaxID=2903746 RepID=UPI003863A99B|nr:VCBS repeat-containing protein [Streptomyces sp. NBC_01077]